MYEKLIAMVESKLSSSELIEFELLLNEIESVACDAAKEDGYGVGFDDGYRKGYDLAASEGE